MASISARRLGKELTEIRNEGCPIGIDLVKADDFETWWFTIEVMGESLYKLPDLLARRPKKERPIDNDRYVRNAPDNPKKTRFHYDDDT
ncbi:hypothetical protein C0995_008565 [Termitomyces sp. Mi166|nr:hypothetical protein C0995_008565 [Termitomyces sp. Mi166\